MNNDVNQRRLSKLHISPEEEEIKQLRSENQKLRERVSEIEEELSSTKKTFDETIERLLLSNPAVVPQMPYPSYPVQPQQYYQQITWWGTDTGNNLRLLTNSGDSGSFSVSSGDGNGNSWNSDIVLRNDGAYLSCDVDSFTFTGGGSSAGDVNIHSMDINWNPESDQEDYDDMVANG